MTDQEKESLARLGFVPMDAPIRPSVRVWQPVLRAYLNIAAQFLLGYFIATALFRAVPVVLHWLRF